MVASFEKKSNPFNGRARSGKIVPEYIPNSDDWGVVEVGTAPKQPTTVLETADWLTNILGISPLPNCPQYAEKFGISPKSPCSMAWDDDVRTEQWKIWQNTRPPLIRQAKWWDKAKNKNADKNGIGAIAGLNHKGHYIEFIDIDAKHFDSQDECDRIIQEWEDKFPILKECLRYRTPGGGYRYIIALSKKDEIFACVGAFNLEPDQEESIGEILHNNGGHSLFPPSIRADGKAYYWDRWFEYPPVIDSYLDIGLFPKLKAGDKKSSTPTTPNDTVTTDNQSSDKEVRGNKTEFDQLIKDINATLELEEAFNWTGHNFTEEKGANGRKLKGNCPWHESSSGTAFYCEKLSNGNLVFNCPSCGGGNIFDYRHSLNSISILPKPRGKAFTGVLRELAGEAGLDCSFLDKPKKEKKVKSTPPETTEGLHCDTITPELAILENHFETGDWLGLNGAYYKYKDDYWQMQEEESIKSIIANKLRQCFIWKKDEDSFKKKFPYYTEQRKKSTYSIVLSSLFDIYKNFKDQHAEDVAPHRLYRCFSNGIADMRSGELLDHDKKYLLTSKIDAEYKPGAKCPEIFENFIKVSYGEKYINIIRAVINMYINPTAPYGYFAYVVGASGSGKGTLIRFIGSLFEKIASLTQFSEIMSADDRHKYLTGVDFCCFADVSGYQPNLEAFYELVDNGKLQGRALYIGSSYSKQWDCRFMVGSTHPIRVENTQGGWARRALIIPSKVVPAHLKDFYLEKSLAKVKGDVIGWALGLSNEERDKILHDYVNNDADLKSIRREHEIDADSIKGFIDRCLRPSGDGNVLQPDEVYHYYAAYCKEAGFKALNLDNFKNRIKTAIPDFYVKRLQKRVNGRQVWISPHFINVTPTSPHSFSKVSSPFSDQSNYICNLKYCYEGGLSCFEEFTLKQTSVTPLSPTLSPTLGDTLVTPESIANTSFQEVSPTSPTSPHKTKAIEIFSENKISDQNKIEKISHIERLPVCDGGDSGDSGENPCCDGVLAVTNPKNGVGDTLVTVGDSTNVPNAPTAPPSIKSQLGDFKVGDRIQLEPQAIPDYNKISPIIADVVMVYEGVDGWEVVFYEYERWNKQDQKYESIGGEFGRGSVLSGWVKKLS